MTSKKLKAGKRRKLYKMRGCSTKKCNLLGGQNTMYSQNYKPHYPNTGPLPNNVISLAPNFKKGGAASFVGSPWTPTNLPSVSNGNHYPLNSYNSDVQLATKMLGANPPFSKGGRRMRKSLRTNSKSKSKSNSKSKKNKLMGGSSNSIWQDLVNLGRSANFSSTSTYNALNGIAAPVNPLPWKGQFGKV